MVSTITGNKYLEFNEPKGHSMFNTTEGEALLARRASLLAIDAFGANYTIEQYIGSEVLIKSTAQYVSELINDYYSKFQLMAYEEFNSTSNAVPCNIHGHTCIWQWGYVKEQHQYTDFHFTSTDIGESLPCRARNYYSIAMLSLSAMTPLTCSLSLFLSVCLSLSLSFSICLSVYIYRVFCQH